MEVKKIKQIIENTLNKNKANNVVIIDLKKKSYIADYMIIASGTSSRHLQSLSENILDAIDIIVHLFHPEKRSFYDLEKMWSENLPKEKALI